MRNTLAGEMPWRYMHKLTSGVRQGIRLIDVGEYFDAWGAAFGADLVDGLDVDSSPVHLCWGSCPWLIDLCRVAYDAAGEFRCGAKVLVLDVEEVEEWWGMDLLDEGEKLIAFVNVCGNVTVDSAAGKLLVDTSTLDSVDLESDCWWAGFEGALDGAGWYVDGDEGDGTQGWLWHAGCIRCEKCFRGASDDESPIGESGICKECGEQDSEQVGVQEVTAEENPEVWALLQAPDA